MQSLRDLWKLAGSPSCAHERLERETKLGNSTGTYVCMHCGQGGIGPNWPYAPVQRAEGA